MSSLFYGVDNPERKCFHQESTEVSSYPPPSQRTTLDLAQTGINGSHEPITKAGLLALVIEGGFEKLALGLGVKNHEIRLRACRISCKACSPGMPTTVPWRKSSSRRCKWAITDASTA